MSKFYKVSNNYDGSDVDDYDGNSPRPLRYKIGVVKTINPIKKEKTKDIQVAFLALNKKREVGSFTIQPGFNYALRMKDSEKLVPAKSWFLEMNNQ